MRLALVMLCIALAAEARPRRHIVVAAAEKLDLKAPSAALLARAQALYLTLDYAEVLQIGRELERRKDLTLPQKLEAYRLLGSAVAIVEDPIDAEPVARRLYNLNPDYALPAGTPAKILNAFQKAQREVREAIAQAEALKRQAQIARMKLVDPLPQVATGGLVLDFSLRVLDPDSQIERVVVHYRRAGQLAYSGLALERDRTGQWSGALPAELTADPNGFVLEHWVETADAKGPLLTVGAADQPLRIPISAGALPKAREKKPITSHKPFYAALGGALVGFGVTAGFAAGAVVTRTEQAQPTLTGSHFNALVAQGSAFSAVTLTAAAITAALGIVALILGFQTEWEP